MLFWDDQPSSPSSGYRVYPSEGSHAGFAPRGWRQRALQVCVACSLLNASLGPLAMSKSLLTAEVLPLTATPSLSAC